MEIYLYGVVGEQITLNSILKQVNGSKPDRLDVLINSEGGYVDEGFAIYDYLRSLSIPVRTVATGIVASAASVIFMAGKQRAMYPNAQLMVHNPWGQVQGEAEDMIEYAALLKKHEARIITAYVSATKKEQQEISDMMSRETYLSADEAVQMGFATSILQPQPMAKLNPDYNMSTFACKVKEVLASLGLVKPKNMLFTLDNGAEVFVYVEEGEELVGKRIVIAENGEPTETPAPDGQHTLESGTTVTVEGGVITAVMEAETDSTTNPTNEMDEKLKALEAENANLRAELDAMKEKTDDMEGAFNELLGAVQAMAKNTSSTASTPVANNAGQNAKAKEMTFSTAVKTVKALKVGKK